MRPLFLILVGTPLIIMAVLAATEQLAFSGTAVKVTAVDWPSDEPQLPHQQSTVPPPTEPGQDDKDGKDDRDSDTPVGAYIELHAPSFPVGVWTVVQWQDSAGGWHNVEGWQGSLQANGYRRWWVAAKDFDTGPFRWLVTAAPNREIRGKSESFKLPDRPNQIRRVEISPK